MKDLDEDGQPPPRFFRPRVNERLVDELLGLCKGIIVDGVATDGEAAGLRRWITGHPDVAIGYPGGVLADRLQRVFADGHVSEEERADLAGLLEEVTGERIDQPSPLNLTATAFFEDPPPTVLFDGQEYVFTGRMLYAARAECEREVRDRGGIVHPAVRKRTNFLVVGPMASEAWLHSTHGTKLLDAAHLREKGAPIHIIPEEHWIVALEMGA